MTMVGPHNPQHSHHRAIAPLIGAVLVLMACGPSAPPSSGGGTEPSARAGSKTLVMGFRSDLSALVAYGRPRTTSTEPNEHWFIFHGNLTAFDVNGNVVPQVAQKVPSTEDGDWKVNPDGTMEVTWRIKPGAVWHDGAPLTAQDYVFGYEVVMDRRLAVAGLGEVLNVSRVQALDAQTLVVSWKTVSTWAGHNGVWGIPAIPRHLLEEIYRGGDTQAFENSPIWGSQWVGLGPYRVTDVVVDVQLEAEAFDQYILGRPKIDKLVFRIIQDLKVLQTNVMAGAVDVVTPGASFKPEHILELQRGWEGEAYTIPIHGRTIYLQWRDPTAAWAQDRRFRQAMLYSLDRADWVESLQYGLTEVIHYYAAATDPLSRLADQRGIVKYSYDPARAERLFAETGWIRGPDGLLRNSAGQTVPFRCCRVATEQDAADVRESLAVVDALKRAGIRAEHPYPAAPPGLSVAEARRFVTINREGNVNPYRFSEQGWFATLISSTIPAEENRWVGANTGGWSDPTYDGLFSEMTRALQAGPRQELQLRLLKVIAEELPVIPLWYEPLGVVHRKGVEGMNRRPHAPPLTQMSTWNIHTWDLK